MAGFDPDAYLAQKPAAAPAAFDPDAYLATVSGGPRKTGTIVDQIPGSSVKAPAATQPVGKDFTFGQKVMGALEVAPALLTSAVTAPIVEAPKRAFALVKKLAAECRLSSTNLAQQPVNSTLATSATRLPAPVCKVCP
jgi:hypothetical protein